MGTVAKMTILTIGISDGLRVIRHENGMWYGQIRDDVNTGALDIDYDKQGKPWIIVTMPYHTAEGARRKLIEMLQKKQYDFSVLPGSE
jgi:hypothetical protein